MTTYAIAGANGHMAEGVTRRPENTTPTTIEAFAPIFAAVYNAG